ncbi:MAG: DUF192 domain-containing protein [Candidatus Aenigmarchaeota archaeon]|nr:DUF192 domain-containing protein [Candidatus Aenigmarchaeota archaeon]
MSYAVFRGKRKLCLAEMVAGIGAKTGLMFRRKLKRGEGLILKIPNCRVSIHTMFVFFPIDLFFLDARGKVVEVAKLAPWRIYLPKKKAAHLLEANAGELSVKVGDRLSFRKSGIRN